MHSLLGCSFICIVTLIIVPRGFPQEPAVSESGGLRITVLTYDYANVSPETLTEAKQEAERIFRLEGIEIVWLDRPRNPTEIERAQASEQAADGPSVLSLRIVPRSMAQRYPAHKNPHAFGFGAAPRAQGFAFIFFHRVEELAVKEMARLKGAFSRKPHASLAGILGHVMAHEIAHALACPHASTGLMHSEWSARELAQIARRELLFTPRQGQFLRTQARRTSQGNPKMSNGLADPSQP